MKSISSLMARLFGMLVLISMIACSAPEKKTLFEKEEVQHYCVQQLTNVIVYDIFSPPVASRIYAYSNLAFYEALKAGYPEAPSITAQCKGFGAMPTANTNTAYDYRLSAATAFLKVSEALVFSKDSVRNAIKTMQGQFDDLESDVFERSVQYGEAVAQAVVERSKNDNYKITRGMPRYSVFAEVGKWQQTPPDYADATEPYWKLIQPLRMDSAAQCRPPAPPAFDSSKSSQYYKELMEVYNTRQTLTAEQDSIAIYWDDNPFVTQHKGHLTFANKKTTPVGHWMGITSILCKQYAKGNALLTARTFALTSAAIFDGFISCWEEKYRSRTVRPVTVIREWIDPLWDPLLQTPPFPEYTSGHSVISGAASTVLDKIFGAVPFLDTTEVPYLGMKRSFASPKAAAAEASISRLYGGIHYRAALEEGILQGERVGTLFTQLLP
jgi:hypothetical protein